MTDLVPRERRKPGRKPGCGKIPGSGRKPGGKNKVASDFRAIILTRGKPLELLCDISRGVKIRVGPQAGPGTPQYVYPTMQERASAAKILVDKLLPAAQEITGKDGAPLHPAPKLTDMQSAQKLAFIFARQLHNQGYRIDGKGKISPKTTTSPKPTSDRSAEIEAAQAAILPQAAAPGPTPEEEAAARRERADERYLLTRSEEQGFSEQNQPNVVRFRPNAR